MLKMRRNLSSPDFPLFVSSHQRKVMNQQPLPPLRYNNKGQYNVQNMRNNCKSPILKRKEFRERQLQSYTNENMDFFRLDSNKEIRGIYYHNKHYESIQPIDRSAEIKAYDNNKNMIKYIDKIKGDFSINQEQDVLDNILSKNEQIMQERKTPPVKRTFSPYTENDKGRLSDKEMLQLYQNYNKSRLPFRMRNKVDVSNNNYEVNNVIHGYYSYNQNVPPQYLRNMNDYHINEGDYEDERKRFKFRLKDQVIKDTINHTDRVVKNYNNTGIDKWSPFFENYIHCAKNGFQRKGGYFSEYLNNQKGNIFY